MQMKHVATFSPFRVLFTLVLAGAGLRLLAAETEQSAPGAWPALGILSRESPDSSAHVRSPEASGGALALSRAIELALMHSPDLAASAQGVLAAEGAARQAGALPNPELELEAEEFGGSGSLQGYDAAITHIRLSQSLELGGKRGKRQAVAQAEARLAGWVYESSRLDVIASTQRAFVDVLVSQGRLALADSLLVLAEEVRKIAAERVRSGRISPLEETKAGVEVAVTRIGVDRARREAETARKRLASAWGENAPVFKEARGDLENLAPMPPLESLLALLDGVPEVARWSEEATKARHALALARAQRMPDVGLSAGVSRFEENGYYAGTVGLSLPLPLFDRKAGAIAEAEHAARRVEHEQRAARLRATTAFMAAYHRVQAAWAEATTLKAELIPAVEKAFHAAQAGYREGKYGHLEVLDTQRTLHEARTRYLDVLAEYHKAAADMGRLTGTPLRTIE